MSDDATVVVLTETPTPIITPQSAPSAPTPTDLVEVIHDDAYEQGRLVERVNTLDGNVSTLAARVAILESAATAALDAAIGTADAVENLAEVVEELVDETPTETLPDPEPEPEDTPPGKTHWLHRSSKEWRGKE